MWHVAAAAAAAVAASRTHTQQPTPTKNEEAEQAGSVPRRREWGGGQVLTLSSRCKCLEINLCRLQRCHKKTLINVYTLPGAPQ